MLPIKVSMVINPKISQRFNQLNCCIVIPTYNNVNTVGEVISKALQYTHNIIVINDGSTQDKTQILNQFDKIELISYSKNRGKGYALKKGFKKALELGYDYAITMDSDGQHQHENLTDFLDELEQHHNALIVGARTFKKVENMPGRNSFANRFSNFWFQLQTGVKLPDTQSGFRLYPLQLFRSRKYVTRKYEFELEVLVRAAWTGMKVTSIPIATFYQPKEKRVSHFRPFRDFFRISVLNFVLTFLAIAFYRPRQVIRKYKNKKIREIIKEDLLSGKLSNKDIALGIGFGVFMGIIPIWGYQLALAFILAHIFKMNKAVVFFAANISLPPLIPFILYLSYVTGGFVLGEGTWVVDFDLTLKTIKTDLVRYLVGSFVLAIGAGLFFGLLSYLTVPLIKKLKKK